MNSKAIGELSEAMVLVHFLKKGMPVLLPFGNNQRYDLVIDEGGVLVKAQVKTGRLTDGCITFKTSSINGVTGKRTSYVGAIDVFLVYCPETDGVYRVPVAECGASSMTLRIDKPRSGPKTTLNWARDYLA